MGERKSGKITSREWKASGCSLAKGDKAPTAVKIRERHERFKRCGHYVARFFAQPRQVCTETLLRRVALLRGTPESIRHNHTAVDTEAMYRYITFEARLLYLYHAPMARPDLITISVYVDPNAYEQIRRAAELENRSMSNYLLDLGVRKARELGIAPSRQRRKRQKQRRRTEPSR